MPSFVGVASALKGSVVGKAVEIVIVMLLSVSVDFWRGREMRVTERREGGKGWRRIRSERVQEEGRNKKRYDEEMGKGRGWV